MSRSSHLPPRYPLQSRSPSTRAAPDSPSAQHKSLQSQSSLPKELPSRLDNLLSDLESCPRGTSLRRSVSDPVAIMEATAGCQSPVSPFSEGSSVSTMSLHVSKLIGGDRSVLEANCAYGPNSPRQKSGVSDSERSMLTALLESVPRKPLLYLSADFLSSVGVTKSDLKGDTYVGAGDADPDDMSRRHCGQRSRVRKLQYIAELEKTVEDYQTMGADLAARVASQFQQRAALSIENKKLKQQMAILQQENMIKGGQNQSLKIELEKLKAIDGCHRKSNCAASCLEMGYVDIDRLGNSLQRLDMRKLSLGGNTFPSNHGMGH